MLESISKAGIAGWGAINTGDTEGVKREISKATHFEYLRHAHWVYSAWMLGKAGVDHKQNNSQRKANPVTLLDRSHTWSRYGGIYGATATAEKAGTAIFKSMNTTYSFSKYPTAPRPIWKISIFFQKLNQLRRGYKQQYVNINYRTGKNIIRITTIYKNYFWDLIYWLSSLTIYSVAQAEIKSRTLGCNNRAGKT